MTSSRILKADGLLLVTAAIWGSAFVAQKAGMDHVGPFLFNGVRFALGAFFLLPLILTRPARAMHQPLGRKAPHLGLAGIIAGLFLFGGSSLQQVGLLTTTAGKAGFITGLYVVIVPLLGLAFRQRSSSGAWIGSLLAVSGLYLLTVKKGLHIAPGDLLVLLCAFMFAVHVLVIGWLAPLTDVLKLAALQFAVNSILSLAVAFRWEVVSLAALWQAGIPILYGGLISVGIAYTLQVAAQKEAPATHAAIILSLETVFAVLAGWLLLGEEMSPRGMIGCGLMLSGMLAVQLIPGKARS
jgi:drug/metabolite transporter (DMT)-like permease